MVVHHDDIIFEGRVLPQCRVHGVGYCLLAVEYRYDDRSLYAELLFVEVGAFIFRCIHERADTLKVMGHGVLHLFLYFAVARVHIVELFHTAFSVVSLLFGVKIFVYVEYFRVTAYEKSQVVQSCPLVVRV